MVICSLKQGLNLSLDLAEFLGWHVGDGCISINKRYSEYALAGDINEEYPFYENIVIPTFNKIFKKYLNKPVILKKYKSTGVCGIYLFDKNFVGILQREFNLMHGKKINIQVPNVIKTDDQKKHFLRGLFDTDGSIYFCRSNYKSKKESLSPLFHYKAKIKIATISKILIEQIYDILVHLGFSPRLYRPRRQRANECIIYSLVLDTKKNTTRWIKEIGFQSIKHLTKIKVWEKFGFCPPYTSLHERIEILNGNLNPLDFYPKSSSLS